MSSNESEVLSPKHEAFIEGILVGKSRTQAAIDAGLGGSSRNYAGVSAYHLIRNPKIKARVQKRVEDAISLTDEEIIGTLTSHQRGHITDILDEYGNVDPIKLEENGHIVQSIETKRVYEGTGKDKVPVDITKVKLYSSQSAAGLLAKIRGMDNHTQKIELELTTSEQKITLTQSVQNGLNAGIPLEECLKLLTMTGVSVDELKLIDAESLVFPEESITILPEEAQE